MDRACASREGMLLDSDVFQPSAMMPDLASESPTPTPEPSATMPEETATIPEEAEAISKVPTKMSEHLRNVVPEPGSYCWQEQCRPNRQQRRARNRQRCKRIL